MDIALNIDMDGHKDKLTERQAHIHRHKKDFGGSSKEPNIVYFPS